MSFTIQTNVDSMLAQENLRVNSDFQSRTIQRLTSGYRINQSGDDAAGLSVANKYRSDVAELTQGVRNANDGISTLQIVDGGLNNISKIIDRLKTLATQSASSTFKGSRTILNSEYQAMLTEITRQANNIGLVEGGGYNRVITVYTGGGETQSNSQVSIDLSGGSNRVDASGFGISTTSISGGGTALTGNSIRLDNPALSFLNGSATQVFTFRVYNGSGIENVTARVTGTAAGISGTAVVDQLNAALSSYGISASVVTSGTDVGELQFGGARAFTVSAAAASGGQAVADASTAVNTGNYHYDVAVGAFTAVSAGTETVTFSNANGTADVSFTSTTGDTVDNAIATINQKTAALGIYAVKDAAGTGFSIQSNNDFTLVKTAAAGTGVVITGGAGAKTVIDAAAGATSTANALSALTSLTNAVASLGQVQGRIGTGQNKLQYAVVLAQSQISSYSAAESRIRDADVASEAANLTKAQILQQASLAAMAQANSAPQGVLALLRT